MQIMKDTRESEDDMIYNTHINSCISEEQFDMKKISQNQNFEMFILK